jgi:predicted RNA-binding protein with PUA-like domain
MMVDVAFVRQFRRPVALAELKADPSLAGLELLRKGNRLSIQPMSKEHFERIEKLGASSA